MYHSSALLLNFFLFSLAVQLTAFLGCLRIFALARHKKLLAGTLALVISLNGAYLFLFSPTAIPLPAKPYLDYVLLYPFFIYMLLCLILVPFFVLSWSGSFIIKGLSRLQARLRPPAASAPNESGDADQERRLFMKIATSGIICSVSGCSAYGAYLGKDRLKIATEEIGFAGLPADMDGFSIVQISDIHVGPFMDAQQLSGFVEIVNELAGDIVVITGDIVNWGTSFVEGAASALAGIRARTGVYAVLGNHDFYADVGQMCRLLEKGHIEVLRNRWCRLYGSRGSAVYLLGIDDPGGRWYAPERFSFLSETIRGVPDDGFKILLSHRPNAFEHAPGMGIDLTLAGHTHGGQLVVPVPGGRGLSLARVAYRHDYGLYRRGESYLYVNSGLGVVGPPIRINCPREISRFVLKKI